MPLECHVEVDLPAANSPQTGFAAAVRLGEPREVRVTRSDPDLACGWPVVDGTGRIGLLAPWYVVGGDGGAVFGWITDAPYVDQQTELLRYWATIAGGPNGFVAYDAPDEIVRTDASGVWGPPATIGWPLVPGDWPSPIPYGGLLESAADVRGGITLALAGGAADGTVELWAARVGAAGADGWGPFRLLGSPLRFSDLPENQIPGAVLQAFGTVLVAQDRSGRVLALWDGQLACGAETTAGRWFAADGTPLGPVFVAAPHRIEPCWSGPWHQRPALTRLPDGSLALQDGCGAWTRRFADAVPAGGPVPGWLAARADQIALELSSDAFIAFLTRVRSNPKGPQLLDVVDAAGVVRATGSLPPFGDGNWSRGGSTVGPEGTMVQFAREELDCSTPHCTRDCVYRIWPGAVRTQ